MDTARTQKFPFILDRNLVKANCTGNLVCTSCDTVVLGCANTKLPLAYQKVGEGQGVLDVLQHQVDQVRVPGLLRSTEGLSGLAQPKQTSHLLLGPALVAQQLQQKKA